MNCSSQPQVRPTRRQFLAQIAGTSLVVGCRSLEPRRAPAVRRILFTSQGKTLCVHADGSGLRVLTFDRPGQATWQPSGAFSDGRRIVMLSMEPRRDGPGRPFDIYYTQTPTHLWIHDLETGSLEEIATRERMAVFYTPALLIGDDRLLVQVVRDRVGQIFSMNLDGSDAKEFTRAGEGLPYGLSLSPDRKRVAFHLASPQGYQIWTSDLEGQKRQLIAAHREHLYFGPMWSPDGAWLAFADCHFQQDPGHDWADICVSRPDGTEMRVVTEGQPMWFGATYGDATHHGGGSNVVSWGRDGSILFPRRMPNSKVPWEFQANRPDTDHFNRDYRPELAVGGVQVCALNPRDGQTRALTPAMSGRWDFRVSESPDGRDILFCRAETGGAPSIWLMQRDGSKAHLLAQGLDASGADHPRWIGAAGSR